jgi:hypothetical protein
MVTWALCAARESKYPHPLNPKDSEETASNPRIRLFMYVTIPTALPDNAPIIRLTLGANYCVVSVLGKCETNYKYFFLDKNKHLHLH